MVVNPDVDVYAKTRNHWNTPKNKKQQTIENQKNTKYRNLSQVGVRFFI